MLVLGPVHQPNKAVHDAKIAVVAPYLGCGSEILIFPFFLRAGFTLKEPLCKGDYFP
jgi:hypothetical protein